MNPVDKAEALIEKGRHIHLMGIGGIGMAGIANLLKQRGLHVSGCDLQANRQTEWLVARGISIDVGHRAEHIDFSVDWVIRSTAVDDVHPEITRARELGIPVSRRGEVLPALMRARTSIAVCGSHGKTTTTSIIAQLLGCGYCIGGEIEGFEGVALDGDIMVVEADESDGTLVGYTPDYAVITNIEYDHMEHHASEAAFIGCFEQLVSNTQKKVFYCENDPVSNRLFAMNPKCEPFSFPSENFPVKLHGRHNQWNAAAAFAVARLFRQEDELLERMGMVKPVARRFETVMEREGIRIISDYAHHPTEITALIQTAKELEPKRLFGVFQPHRYTRTLALGEAFPPSFEGLERLWLLPVYAASEKPLEGGTADDLAQRFPEGWRQRLFQSSSMEEAWNAICRELRTGDCLLIIGAGDIACMAEWARKWCPGEGSNLRPQD